MRLGGIPCNKDCCEANIKHPKAAKQAVVQTSAEGSAKSNAGDEAAVLEERKITRATSKGKKSNSTKARINKKS